MGCSTTAVHTGTTGTTVCTSAATSTWKHGISRAATAPPTTPTARCTSPTTARPTARLASATATTPTNPTSTRLPAAAAAAAGAAAPIYSPAAARLAQPALPVQPVESSESNRKFLPTAATIFASAAAATNAAADASDAAATATAATITTSSPSPTAAAAATAQTTPTTATVAAAAAAAASFHICLRPCSTLLRRLNWWECRPLQGRLEKAGLCRMRQESGRISGLRRDDDLCSVDWLRRLRRILGSGVREALPGVSCGPPTGHRHQDPHDFGGRQIPVRLLLQQRPAGGFRQSACRDVKLTGPIGDHGPPDKSVIRSELVRTTQCLEISSCTASTLTMR
mmetsp:Transcript_32297/g.69030  ORF Transcript_32297/g.69030 Transcript_32297/m.69030 type:complete len:340 (-) Transcript_32297:9-1028(-)